MYRQVLNGFALNSLAKVPNIPDYHLMVGSAELLDSLPLLVYEKAKIPAGLVTNMKVVKELSNEELNEAIANNELEVNDVSWNLALLGNGLGV